MRNRSNVKNWTYRELKTKSGHLETKDFSIVNFCWDKGGDGDVVPGLCALMRMDYIFGNSLRRLSIVHKISP